MRPSIALQANRDAIREIALSHRVKNVRVFGSALHGDDTGDSGLDLLVDPTPETTLMDISKIQGLQDYPNIRNGAHGTPYT